MADAQVHYCNIVSTRATRVGDRTVPAGYVLAKLACRHADEVLFIRQRLGWSHYRVDVDEQLLACQSSVAAPAATPACTIEERAGMIADLRRVNGIGPAIAARLADHYHIPTRAVLASVLADPASAAALEADPILRVSARDLSLWRRQLAATADDQTADDQTADDQTADDQTDDDQADDDQADDDQAAS